jgi:hypothetical protein
MTVAELARFIFRLAKEEEVFDNLPYLQERLCPENRFGYKHGDRNFFLKFYEAIAQLKRRGLLVDVVEPGKPLEPYPRLTSVGEKSYINDEILILIDDAQEVVNSLKEKIPNLDPVVEQYYLESLRTCQEGCYIASVICLGAASERAINCLAEAVIDHDNSYEADIEKQQSISALTRYLSENVKPIFKPIADAAFRSELKDKLEGMARIYRLNRNEAGHPGSVRQEWQRDEQESNLNQFRRYVLTIFQAIAIFNTP